MPTFLWITTMLLSWSLSSRMRACRSSYSRQSASVIPRKVAESRVSLCFRKSCRNSQQISLTRIATTSGQIAVAVLLLAIAAKKSPASWPRHGATPKPLESTSSIGRRVVFPFQGQRCGRDLCRASAPSQPATILSACHTDCGV